MDRDYLRINVGCGEHHAPAPWVNVDTWPGVGPDVVADARALPWPDDAAAAVYLGHVLEHMPMQDVVAAVVEALRVAPVVMIVGPDVNIADRMAAEGEISWDEAHGALHGAGGWPGDEHQWACTAEALTNAAHTAVDVAGGGRVTSLSIDRVPPTWPVTSRIGWQAAVSIRRDN